MFYINYDFLTWLESQGPTHEMPRDIEHIWQMRRNKEMSTNLWGLYTWVDADRASRNGFLDWL